MKRRTLIRGAIAAAALAMSPMMLNTTRLLLADPMRGYFRFTGLSGDVTEFGYNGIVDNGVNGYGSTRMILDKPVTVMSDEYFDVHYEHRLHSAAKCYVKIGKETIYGS